MRALLFALLVLVASTARADARDVSVGAFGAWEIVEGGRGGAGAEVGLTDFLALRSELSGGAVAGVGTFQVLAGPTFMWDVVDWVPTIHLMIGGEFGDSARLMGIARVEVRHYIARKVWLSAGVGGEVHRNDLQPHIMMAAFWQL